MMTVVRVTRVIRSRWLIGAHRFVVDKVTLRGVAATLPAVQVALTIERAVLPAKILRRLRQIAV